MNTEDLVRMWKSGGADAVHPAGEIRLRVVAAVTQRAGLLGHWAAADTFTWTDWTLSSSVGG